MRKIVFASMCLLPVMVCGVCSAQAAGPKEPEGANPEKELAALRVEWARALHDKQLEPSVALFTEDAAFLAGDGSRIVGRDAIRALYRQVFATYSGDITIDSKQVGFSGVLAYDSGSYRETITTVATGAKRDTSGSYLMVLRREPDGQWRIVQQVWTEIPARP